MGGFISLTAKSGQDVTTSAVFMLLKICMPICAIEDSASLIWAMAVTQWHRLMRLTDWIIGHHTPTNRIVADAMQARCPASIRLRRRCYTIHYRHEIENIVVRAKAERKPTASPIRTIASRARAS